MIKKSLLIFVLLSVAASALNYIVYPLFSRILAPSEYVSITISLSLFTQISTFLSSITAITIGLSKSEHNEQANKKIELLQAFLFRLFLIIAVIFLIISPLIMNNLHISPFFALPISLMMLFSIPIQVISGYLNGKNQMAKLGLATLISASSQFTIGIIASIISRNGLITMLSMTIAQVVTLIIIYYIFSNDQLPNITKSLKTSIGAIRNKHMGNIIIYTAATSLAIMAISLVQIIDLFIVQNLYHADTKFYTDIYVISRIVFFAGMIFIWPFLGEINIDHHHFNRIPFAKVIGYFTFITMAALIALYFFGNQIDTILFGSTYDLQLVRTVGILSVLYKYFLLIITAVTLYFVVLRRYMAVIFSILASGVIFIFSEIISKHSSISTILTGLDTIACGLAILGIILLLCIPVRKIDKT